MPDKYVLLYSCMSAMDYSCMSAVECTSPWSRLSNYYLMACIINMMYGTVFYTFHVCDGFVSDVLHTTSVRITVDSYW